jgi:hypothetical protein
LPPIDFFLTRHALHPCIPQSSDTTCAARASAELLTCDHPPPPPSVLFSPFLISSCVLMYVYSAAADLVLNQALGEMLVRSSAI